MSLNQINPVSAWDCSAWVRTYALFLEERLECFRVLKYDMEAERLSKPSPGAEKVMLFFLFVLPWHRPIDCYQLGGLLSAFIQLTLSNSNNH